MALPNSTFTAPGVSFYAPAGESAKNWYQFPSLNGEVLLNDSSGTQVLQSITGNLYYNNELLAKAGDISDIADWADYPALFPVNMNGQPLFDASSVSVNNDISGGGNLFVTGTIRASSVLAGSIGATGTISAGSYAGSNMNLTGNIQGGSLTTTGGLDMANSAITRAASVGISNAGFGPYGSLTSPDGVALTWNGASITTGAGVTRASGPTMLPSPISTPAPST